MKEQYEYLIDKYQVNLVYNGEYATKNNLFSLKKVIHKIGNTYILPCDVWCSSNPFSKNELYSWYMVAEDETEESMLRVNRKRELAAVEEGDMGNRIIGISYILKGDAQYLKERVLYLCEKEHAKELFWDDALMKGNKMYVMPKEGNDEPFFWIYLPGEKVHSPDPGGGDRVDDRQETGI